MLKQLLPWILVPFAIAAGASFVKLNQLKAPVSGSPSFLITLANGQVVQGKIVGMTLDSNNVITLPTAPAVIPTITVFHIGVTSTNNFPIPTGKTICEVSNNIPMSPGEDYTVNNNAIVFINPPVLDDIVRMVCY